MKKNFMPKLGSALFASALLAAGAAHGADYPDRSIAMVVPFSAGGPTDNAARALAEAMRHSLGQTIIVENKGGAGGTIGTSQVARADPNGYTILLMHLGFTTAPSLYKKPGYDAKTSFEPIGMVIDVPMTIIARPDFPSNNIKELVDYLKTNKDKVSLANAGIGSAAHLCGTMLMDALGIDLLTVPYKGTGPAINDLLGKQVDVLCDQTTNTTQHIKAGTVKSYAVTSKARVPTLPDLPTMQEAGFKDFEVGIWVGLWAPKGTPKPIVDKLVKALQDGLADPAFKSRMEAMGATVLPSEANPEALGKKVAQQVPQWAELFKKVGVQPQ
jgi:tripartite-type tricarboxylate transporter receptor subunit TctC